MDIPTLLAGIDFAQGRSLGILKTIESSGQDVQKVLGWRPGPGRAHIGWQAMHLAATLDRYMNVRLKGGSPADESLVANFCSGSTPSDEKVPTLAEIRQKLETFYRSFREFVASLSKDELARVQDFPNNIRRSIGESIILLTWHDAHHQGQIHLTWNLYKAAHGIA